MKKLTKFLVLLLCLVSIVTVFTVVAIASDGEEELTPVLVSSFDFSTKPNTETVLNEGDVLKNSSTKKGIWTIGKADNGNLFVVSTWDNVSGDGDQYEPSIAGSISNTKSYPLSKYPTIAFDFDIKSSKNSFASSATLTSYFYRSTSTSVTNTGSIKLANVFTPVANQWYHVTYIVSSDSLGNVTVRFYIDGVQKYTKSLDKTTTLGSVISSARVASIRIYGVESGDSAISYDNFKYTYYPASYGDATNGFDRIVSYYYNDSYEMPYGTTVAKIGDTCYDDVSKAIAAAGENDVVTLLADVKKELVIGKPVKVDTNKYAADGTIEGSYAFLYNTTNGYQESISDGVYTFAKAANTVIVNWDPACADGCNCFAEYGGHRLTATSEFAPGDVPFYTGTLPEFEIVDGYTKRFVGWSYDNDGIVDELVAIDDAQIAAKTVNIYPVYESVQYAFEIVRNGASTYGFESDFDSMVAAAKTGSTIILHQDVTMYHSIMIKNKNMNITLDLNGHTLNRHYVVVNQYEATVDENGEYIKGDEIGTVTEGYDTEYVVKYSSGALVYANAVFGIGVSQIDYTVNITLTSSKPGANVYAIAYSADRLYVDGEAVKTENLEVTGGLDFFELNPAKGVNINLDTANVNIYSGTLFSGEHGGNHLDTPKETIKIDGGNFYSIGSIDDGAFALKNGEIATVRNANFYANGNRITMNDSSSRDRKTNINFINCNIYDAAFFSRYVNDVYTLTDCRLVNPAYSSRQTVIFGLGTLTTNTSSKVTPASGYVLAPDSSATYSYSNIESITYAFDAATGKITPTVNYTEAITGSFAYQLKRCSEVPESITDARLSMLYYTNFDLVLYLPVIDGMTLDSVSGFTGGADIVKIDDNPYYVYTKASSTAGASDTVKSIVRYTVDSKSYAQCFELSALVYAELILSDPIEEVESKAVANMVRFIKEARIEAGLTVSDKFAELEALYALDDYKNQADYNTIDVDYSELSGVSIHFAIDGTNAGYVIKLNESTFAEAKDAVITVTYADGTAIEATGEYVEATADEGAYYKLVTTKTKAYDIADEAIVITITMPGSTLSGTYSVGAYINATDNALAKAMYEFGVAAKEYREFLETL